MKRNIKIVFLIIITLLINTKYVFASNIYSESFRDKTGNILINLYLDTQNETINAIQGELVFPSTNIVLKEVRDSKSAINFWLEKPNIDLKNRIVFSGITPGGFFGTKNLIFSTVLKLDKDVKGSITLQNLKVIKNTENADLAKVNNFSLDLSKIKIESIDDLNSEIVNDTTPPLSFTPYISTGIGEDIKTKYLVFVTQDKESGIDHYEVKKSYFSKYTIATSPFSLDSKLLFTKIYVKAVDKAKNEVVEELYPNTFVRLYHEYGIIGIIILVFLIYKRKRWLKFIN